MKYHEPCMQTNALSAKIYWKFNHSCEWCWCVTRTCLYLTSSTGVQCNRRLCVRPESLFQWQWRWKHRFSPALVKCSRSLGEEGTEMPFCKSERERESQLWRLPITKEAISYSGNWDSYKRLPKLVLFFASFWFLTEDPAKGRNKRFSP